MKKISKTLIVLLVLIVATVAFAACSGGIDKIEIGVAPQLVFVKGHDLDLSKGTLTVVNSDGTTSQVAMNADGVEVSGYDKNKVGKQTLEISYKEAKVPLEITVAERFVTVNFDKEYIVNESVNVNKGSVTVTTDDGTQMTIPMNDSRISLGSYDNTQEGEKVVSITFTDGSTEYTDTITVNFYGIQGEPKWVNPTKNTYESHETEMDLSGGTITIRSAGSLVREIYLTDIANNGLQIEGFDMSDLSPEHDSKTLNITFSYLGYEHPFICTARFSKISYVKYYANALGDLDLTLNDPTEDGQDDEDTFEMTDEQGKYAISAILEYAQLDADEKALIEDSEREIITIAAARYGIIKFTTDILPGYTDVFDIGYSSYDDKLSYDIKGGTFNRAHEVYDELSDDTNANSKLMYDILDAVTAIRSDEDLGLILLKHGNYVETPAATYLGRMPTSHDIKEGLLPALEYMFDMFDSAKEIKEVTGNNYSAQGTAIETFYNDVLKNAMLRGGRYRYMYGIINNWREEQNLGDLFEVLFRYYYSCYNEEGKAEKKDAIIYNLASTFHLPGQLETIYDMVSDARDYMTMYAWGYAYETVYIMMFYTKARDMIATIESGNDQMYKDLLDIEYEALIANGQTGETLDLTLSGALDVFRDSQYGYHENMFALEFDKDFNEIWDEYIDIAWHNQYLKDEGDEWNFMTHAESFIQKYFKLTPAAMFAFLCSINTEYRENDVFLFDYESASYDQAEENPYYIRLIFDSFFNDKFADNDPLKELYHKLMIALECYTSKEMYYERFETFFVYMDEIAESYELVLGTTENRELFEQYFGGVYEELKTVYELYELQGDEHVLKEINITNPDAVSKYNQLDGEMRKINDLLNEIYGGDTVKNLDLTYIALFEKTQDLIDEILEIAKTDTNVYNKYYYGDCNLSTDPLNPDYGNYEFLFNIYFRSLFNGMLLAKDVPGGNGHTMMDRYMQYFEKGKDNGLRQFLIDTYYLTDSYNKSVTSSTFDYDKAKALVEKFRTFTDEQKIHFLALDSNLHLYRSALTYYYQQKLTSSVSDANEVININNFVNKLFQAEEDYIMFAAYKTQIYATKFESTVTEIKGLYGAMGDTVTHLSTESKAAFDAVTELKAMYDHYTTLTVTAEE